MVVDALLTVEPRPRGAAVDRNAVPGHGPGVARPPARAGRGGPPPAMSEFDRSLADALDGLGVGPGEGAVSVAVLDTGTGDSGVYGHGAYDTASIVKVDILAALLLKAQEARRPLTELERGRAAAMITRSDNVAATALWKRIGGTQGLDAVNRRLGLTETHGDPGGHWGLTRTTAADQLVLLRAVFGDDSPLTDESRAYIRRLMGRVEKDQAWGVSAAAEEAGTSPLKDGWMQRTSTWLWDINTIGQVRAAGHTLLVAVLSNGNATQAAGVSLVETAAQAAVQAVLGRDAAPAPDAASE
jgi:hypothetical protein